MGERPLVVAIMAGGWHGESSAIMRALRDAGQPIALIGTGPHDPPDERIRGVESIPIRPRGPLVGRGNLWYRYPALGDHIARLRPRILHVLTEPWGLLVLQSLGIARRGGGIRVVAHGADNRYVFGSAPERMIRSRVLRRTLPRLAGFASWNSEGIALAREHGLRAGAPTIVVPPTVPDPEVFSPLAGGERARARKALGLPIDAPVAAFVGRLIPEKGVREILTAMQLLGPRAPYLVVWGDGPMREEVAGALRGALRGSYRGAAETDEVASGLAASDLALMPSGTTPTWSEQFGRVAVEAMLAGAPLVTTRSGAIPDVTGGLAVYAPEGDPEALAAAVRDLLDDPGRRRSLAAEARAAALRRFDPARLASELIAFWEDVAR